MSGHLQRTVTILWAEDDEDDQFFVKRALASLRDEVQAVFVSDGECAWEYLNRVGIYADKNRFPEPDLLVTDLKMPRCDGLELITRLRGHHRLSSVPVFVFTSSDLFRDHDAAQRIGAFGFAVKPMMLQEWTACVQLILQHAHPLLSGKS